MTKSPPLAQCGAQMAFKADFQSADTWQEELRYSLRTAEQLAEKGFIAQEAVPQYRALLEQYPLALPRYYASLIDPLDPNCPIRRQAIPELRENQPLSTMRSDPLEDLAHQPAPRITHRYADRVLLHLTPNCSMYCRFCFRKNLLNELSDELFRGQVQEGLDYIASHTELREVIFSGGDPFMVAESLLARIVNQLGNLSHLKRIRFHSRVPVTFPMRVTHELGKAITSSKLPVVVVAHFNHPKEVTAQAAEACERLRRYNVRLLNQSVLLHQVNDSADILARLSESLFEIGVMPYYLHHLDRAKGTQHFDLSVERGLSIYDDLCSRVSGYLVPKYVVDKPGYAYKKGVTLQ